MSSTTKRLSTEVLDAAIYFRFYIYGDLEFETYLRKGLWTARNWPVLFIWYKRQTGYLPDCSPKPSHKNLDQFIEWFLSLYDLYTKKDSWYGVVCYKGTEEDRKRIFYEEWANVQWFENEEKELPLSFPVPYFELIAQKYSTKKENYYRITEKKKEEKTKEEEQETKKEKNINIENQFTFLITQSIPSLQQKTNRVRFQEILELSYPSHFLLKFTSHWVPSSSSIE